MCGRYSLHSNAEVVALQFGLDAIGELLPSYNICPSKNVLVVRTDRTGRRVADRVRWGLVPAWAKDPAIGNKLANARGESVGAKPSFRDSFRQRRCLVPADGFYEWHTMAGRKQPWYLRPKGAALFGLAGITALWQGPGGPLRTVALITTEPNALMRSIHDRMPVIIDPAAYPSWLDRSNQDAATLQAFLRPYPAERMQAHPVSTRVNAPANDEPSLIEEIAGAPLPPESTRPLL